MALISIIIGVVERSLIYSLIVMGIFLTSRILKFDDLSIEGSFGLGGAIAALSLSYGINAWISLLLALFGGFLTGCITGILHTKLKLNNLISGMIVSSCLFSVCLRLCSSTMILPQNSSIFSNISNKLFILIPLCVLVVSLLTWLLKTEIGFLLRSIGTNPQMLQNLNKNTTAYKLFGLGIANSINALAGATLVHYVGYFSIWANIGILIIGLTSLIIGELFTVPFNINLILGSLIYQLIIAGTFELDLFNQDWNKFITGILLVFLLIIHQQYKKQVIS